jgi:hypothetical protein
MQTQPQKEHHWLSKLAGEWTMESECIMGPDQPPSVSRGNEVVRSFGELWIVADLVTDAWQSIMTLGYAQQFGRFVGTFITSITPFLWVYNGVLDPTERFLTLDTEGPSFASEPATCKYRDIIEIIDEDHRTLSSRYLGGDGRWVPAMIVRHQRKV